MALDPTVRYRTVFSNNIHAGKGAGASCLISCDYSMQMGRGTVPCRWYTSAVRKDESPLHDQVLSLNWSMVKTVVTLPVTINTDTPQYIYIFFFAHYAILL
jgi:hypothetical protein